MASPKPGEETDIVIPLDGGLQDTTVDELIAPNALKRSWNTRLSKKLGLPSKAPAATDLSALGTVVTGGAAPVGGTPDNSVIYLSDAQKRITGSTVGNVLSNLQTAAASKQNAYFPAEISAKGSPMSAYVPFAPAVVVNSTHKFFAAMVPQTSTNTYTVNVSVHLLDGTIVVPHTFVVDSGLQTAYLPPFVGLTRHDTSGIRLWYMRSGTIRVRQISVSGTTLTIGTEQNVYTPVGLTGSYQISVCSGGTGSGNTTYAWLVCVSNGSINDLALNQVNIGTYAVATTIIAGVASANSRVAIAETHVGLVPQVALTYGTSVASATRLYNGTTMALLWGPIAGPAGIESCGVSFLFDASGTFVVPIYSVEIATPGTSLAYTEIQFRTLASGASFSSVTHPWVRLQSRPTFHRISASEITPYLLLHQHWGSITSITDPALHLCKLIKNPLGWLLTPVARIGTDKAKLGGIIAGGGAAAFYSHVSAEPLCFDTAGKITISYCTGLNPKAKAVGSDFVYYSRFVEVNMLGNHQAPIVTDTAGTTLIAAAQPAYWDGRETVEYGPLHRPYLAIATTGGTGPNLSGTYSYRACYVWRDSTGQLHRSSPSLPVTISPAGTKPVIRVTIPFGMRDGVSQDQYEVEVYGTANGGSTYVLQPLPNPTIAIGCTTYSYVDDPGLATGALLYSTGAGNSELLAEAPPALSDIAIVGPRAWGIDAEYPNRAVYSKMKGEGLIAHEFNGLLQILFPSLAGDLVAIRDVDGNPTFFTSTGVYQVYGEGPNNNGQGVYTQPRRVSDIHCTSRASVARTPAGIIFQSGDRFALMAGGGSVQLMQDVTCAGFDIVGHALFRDQQELVYYLRNGPPRVWNYALNRWSVWYDHDNMNAVAQLPSGKALTLNTTGDVQLIDPSTVSTTAQIDLWTGWVAPAGPQGECQIREVWFQAIRSGSHGVTMTAYVDYNTTPITRTWSAAEITTLMNANNRYSIGLQINNQTCRSVMVRVEEISAAGEAMQPLNLTIAFTPISSKQRRALKNGALK